MTNRNYLGRIGLREDEAGRASLERALNRAHVIRQFEIEHYWKRSNYFWLLQAAVLAGFGLTFRANANLPLVIPVGISCLGLLCALASLLSARGSKFWQENWEAHIDFLEEPVEGILHRSSWVSERSWSVSRVNEILLVSFVVFWLFLFVVSNVPIAKSSPNLGRDCGRFIAHWVPSLFAVLATSTLAVTMLGRKTEHLNSADGTGIFHPNGKQLVIRKLSAEAASPQVTSGLGHRLIMPQPYPD